MPELPDHAVPPFLAAYDLVPPVEIFALPLQGASNKSVGIRTAAGDFIAKTYWSLHATASIHYEHRLLTWLGQAGRSFAVPVPIPTRDGALLCQGPHGRVALVTRQPGACLDPYNLDHAELLGAALGELQTVLRHYPTDPRPGRPPFSALFHFPAPYHDPFTLSPAQLDLPDEPPHVDLLGWWRAEVALLQAFVDGPYRALPWQVCHNDIAPANVLVDAGRVSAVLDWEFSTPAARALDVAMGLRMTMRVWENPEPWEAARRFCHGYTQWISLTEAEVRAIPILIRLRSAIPVLWSLGRPLAPGAGDRILRGIEYLQNYVLWLDRHEEQFVDVVMKAVKIATSGRMQ